MISIHPQIDGRIRTLISSGDICSSNGRLTADLDSGLHDAVLISFCFSASMKDGAILSIAGVFPDLRHLFLLEFQDYKRLVVEGVVMGEQIGVQEAFITKKDDSYSMLLLGEFDNQKISLVCRKAEYKKYRLQQPITRLEMGWL